jgi:hyperosmotically inducible protein
MKTLDTMRFAAAAICAALAFGVAAQEQATVGQKVEHAADTAGEKIGSVAHKGGSHLEDAALTSKVKSALLAAKNLKSTGIHVKSREGVVHLTGHVRTREEKNLAIETAKGVSGVESVVDKLLVRAH